MSGKFAFTSKMVKDIDLRKLEQFQKQFTDAPLINVGFPANGKAEPDGTLVATVAYWNHFGTENIPERPFMTQAIQNNRAKYIALNRKNLVAVAKGAMKMKVALGQLGEVAKASIQKEIRSGNFKPLSQKTIDAKGSSKPLIDTGNMIQSVQWEFEEK